MQRISALLGFLKSLWNSPNRDIAGLMQGVKKTSKGGCGGCSFDDHGGGAGDCGDDEDYVGGCGGDDDSFDDHG